MTQGQNCLITALQPIIKIKLQVGRERKEETNKLALLILHVYCIFP